MKINLIALINLISKKAPIKKLGFGILLGQLEIRIIRNLAIAFFLLSTFYFLLSTGKVLGQDFSLGIYPPIIQIDALSPSKISTPITLENLSAESVTLSIQLKQFIPSEKENGEITYIDRPDDPHKKIFS